MSDRPPPHLPHPLPAQASSVPCRVRLPGQVSVSTQILQNREIVAEHAYTVPLEGYEAIRNPAYVGVKGGVTQQPRPFESIRVDVEVRLPCHAHDEALDAAYARASAKVNEYIQLEMDNAMGTTDNTAQSPLHG